jgi:membrane protease YdiL (CAAX protease family)
MKSLFRFIISPVYKEDTVLDLKYRLNIFCQLLVLALLLSLSLGLLIGIVELGTSLELGQHAVDRFLKKFPVSFVFLTAVFLAPILEELLFRGPLQFFRNSRFFPWVFYASTLVFGFYHITNFSMSEEILFYSPLLVAPQLCIGLILGYLRVRFGLVWAIALHAAYNAVLIGPFLIMTYMNIPMV